MGDGEESDDRLGLEFNGASVGVSGKASVSEGVGEVDVSEGVDDNGVTEGVDDVEISGGGDNDVSLQVKLP